jgi:hypothetical protein
MPGLGQVIQKRLGTGTSQDPRRAFNQAWQQLGPQAGQQGQQYWSELSSFDPTESINTYARGAASEANKYLTETLGNLRGQAVGAGRLDTGFFDTDQGEVVRDVYRNLNERIAQQAVTGAGMNLSRLGQMGGWAQGTRQDYLDLLSGELDRRTSERNAKQQARAQTMSGLAGLAGTVASFLF